MRGEGGEGGKIRRIIREIAKKSPEGGEREEDARATAEISPGRGGLYSHDRGPHVPQWGDGAGCSCRDVSALMGISGRCQRICG